MTVPSPLAELFRSSARERVITGKMPARGYVRIGRAYIIEHKFPQVNRESISEAEVPHNLNNLNKAIESSQGELDEAKEKVQDQPIEVASQLKAMIEFHEKNLPSLQKKIRAKIENSFMNALDATMAVIEDMADRMRGSTLSHVIDDYKALGDRIMRNIWVEEGFDISNPNLEGAPEGCFVIADKLSPSDCIYLVTRNIRGLIIQHGAASGHVAVIAKELGIPSLFTEGDIVGAALHDDMPIIIDGEHGTAYLNPSEQTINKFQEDIKKEERKRELRKLYKGRKIESTDGVSCRVYSNINFTASASRAKENVSDGIGLYRTEWLFTSCLEEPSLEDQRRAYGYVINAVDGHSTTFRLLDTEGDKNEDNWLRKANRWELMRNQVEAIMLAASDHGITARILLPVVRSHRELETINSYIDEVTSKMQSDGIEVPETKLGMMVEIPASANEIQDYIEYADFFSIGSNDLIAWTCGQVRNSEQHEEYEDPTNRTVMNLLEIVINEANKAGKPVSLCGRIASNPKYTALLLGLGLTKFSTGVENILDIKERISQINVGEAKQMVSQLKGEMSKAKRNEILTAFNKRVSPSKDVSLAVEPQ